MTFADNSDRKWMTSEEWAQLAEMPFLEALIQIGDIDLAEAIGRYETVVERVQARLRSRTRDRVRREKEFAEIRASLPKRP